ncbi:hypothetical protein ACFPTO_14710 [Paraburkholderia denitrificans]|uniref:Uncharacterized protein n=1 Tax=Paraburkholderia denitrificans TaxID=694025 RepID=A0ABW0JAC9_9BURK
MTRIATMTLDAIGIARPGDTGQRFARATLALRRASGFTIFTGGLIVLASQALTRLAGG